jgi:hypothetical protein
VLVGVGVLAVLNLLALAYCLLDLATSRPADVRGLPKPVWFVVLLLPLVGPACWYLFGRPEAGAVRGGPKVLPDAAPQSRTPDDDEEFLRQLRRRTEEQRRQAEREQRPDEDDRPA